MKTILMLIMFIVLPMLAVTEAATIPYAFNVGDVVETQPGVFLQITGPLTIIDSQLQHKDAPRSASDFYSRVIELNYMVDGMSGLPIVVGDYFDIQDNQDFIKITYSLPAVYTSGPSTVSSISLAQYTASEPNISVSPPHGLLNWSALSGFFTSGNFSPQQAVVAALVIAGMILGARLGFSKFKGFSR